MKKLLLLPILYLSFFGNRTFAQDSIPVTISSYLWSSGPMEWLHFKITNMSTNQIWYDSLATVEINMGFNDTVYLDSGIYIQ
jgi:hypothetical protein